MGQWNLRRNEETGEPINKKEMAELIKRLIYYHVSVCAEHGMWL